MSRAPAWIIGFPGDHLAAVGELELVHVLADEPEGFNVPGSPRYCHQVILWEDNVVPIIDIGKMLAAGQEAPGRRHYGIVRYRLWPTRQQRFGAFLMDRIPQRVNVDDASAYALPDPLAAWRDFVISCFVHEDRPVPILDIGSLFSGTRAAG
jgi:chemotaxis signal transduction protein